MKLRFAYVTAFALAIVSGFALGQFLPVISNPDLPVGFDARQVAMYQAMTDDELAAELQLRHRLATDPALAPGPQNASESVDEASARRRRIYAVHQRCIDLLEAEIGKRYEGQARKSPNSHLRAA